MKRRGARVSVGELTHFTKHIATLLEVGFPPLEMTRILRDQKSSPAMREAIALIVDSIHEGHSLSDGMARSPRIFDGVYITFVRSGEATGRLPATLKRLVASLERARALKRDIANALIYPTCVVVTTAAVSSLLLIFIIPSFKELFSDLGTPLPLLTRGVISISEIMMTWGPWILGIIFFICLILSRFLQTPRGRRLTDTAALHTPLLGTVLLKASLARSCRTLANALDGGIPILAALTASAQAAGNTKVQQEIAKIRSDVAEGISISHSLPTSKLFPSLSVEMLGIGERTGSLDRALENISTDLEEEVSQRVANLKQLLEPVLIVTLGAVVGTLVMAMYLPIFSMGELFN
jgi:type IV pilus assembly protein PilC